MTIPREDNVADIIGKAQRGLRISDTELAEKARVSSQKIRKLREGDFDELALLRVAPALGLAARALCELATGEWHPKKINEREGLGQFNTRYHDMAVNAYLIWDPGSRAAAAFDTGADCSEMVRFATKEKLSVKLILLTHAHSDHVADLPRLREETGGQVFAPAREPVPGAESIEEGKRFRLGKSELLTRTKAFALQILRLVDHLPRTTSGRAIGNQLVRSGTSVGANYRSACRSRLRAEL